MTDRHRTQLEALRAEASARIAQLNAAYAARHGFPFIACVAHYTKAGILFEMERRLGHDGATELRDALTQIFAITRLRLDRLIDHATAVAPLSQAA